MFGGSGRSQGPAEVFGAGEAEVRVDGDDQISTGERYELRINVS